MDGCRQMRKMSAGRGERGKLWADEETLVGKCAWSNSPLDLPSETVRLTWAFYLRLWLLTSHSPSSPSILPASVFLFSIPRRTLLALATAGQQRGQTRITIAIERKTSKRSWAFDSLRSHLDVSTQSLPCVVYTRSIVRSLKCRKYWRLSFDSRCIESSYLDPIAIIRQRPDRFNWHHVYWLNPNFRCAITMQSRSSMHAPRLNAHLHIDIYPMTVGLGIFYMMIS